MKAYHPGQCCQHTEPQGLACSVVLFRRADSRRLPSGPARADRRRRVRARARESPAATSSRPRRLKSRCSPAPGKIGRTPALAAELPAAQIVDVKIPVRALMWSWNRLEWPPVEWLAGDHDVVHSQSPLLIPARRAAQVVTIHDLDFLRHPEQMTRGDAPRLPGAGTLARGARRCRDRVVALRRRRSDARVAARRRSRVHVCPPGRTGVGRRGAARRRLPESPRRAHSVRGHARAAEERRHACSTPTRGCARRCADAPPLVLAGPSHARLGALGSAMRAAAAGGSRRRSPATWTPRRRIASVCGRARCWCCRRSKKASACRCSKPWRAACRWWSRRADRCPKSRAPRRRRSIRTMSTAWRARCSALLERSRRGARQRRRGLAQAARYSWAACADAARGAPIASAMEVHARRRRCARAVRPADRRGPVPGRLLDGVGDERRRRGAISGRCIAHAPPDDRRAAGTRTSDVVAGGGGTRVGAVGAARARCAPTGPMCCSRRATLLRSPCRAPWSLTDPRRVVLRAPGVVLVPRGHAAPAAHGVVGAPRARG